MTQQLFSYRRFDLPLPGQLTLPSHSNLSSRRTNPLNRLRVAEMMERRSAIRNGRRWIFKVSLALSMSEYGTIIGRRRARHTFKLKCDHID